MAEDMQLDFDRLSRRANEQDATSSTAALYGATGASFAIVLLIAQLGIKSAWVISSLVLASIALPLFTGAAISEQVVNGIKPPYRESLKLTPFGRSNSPPSVGAGVANPTLNAMEVIANSLGLTVYELWSRVRDLSKP